MQRFPIRRVGQWAARGDGGADDAVVALQRHGVARGAGDFMPDERGTIAERPAAARAQHIELAAGFRLGVPADGGGIRIRARRTPNATGNAVGLVDGKRERAGVPVGLGAAEHCRVALLEQQHVARLQLCAQRGAHGGEAVLAPEFDARAGAVGAHEQIRKRWRLIGAGARGCRRACGRGRGLRILGIGRRWRGLAGAQKDCQRQQEPGHSSQHHSPPCDPIESFVYHQMAP